jgi:hypothetical protein
MAFTLYNKTYSEHVTSQADSATVSWTPTAGHMVVVAISNWTSDGTAPTVSDSLSNTWVKDAFAYGSSGPYNSTIYRSFITTGGSDTITVTFPANVYCTITIAEYTYQGTVLVDTTGTSVYTNTLETSFGPTLDLEYSGDLVVLHLATNQGQGQTYTAPSGYTIEESQPTTPSNAYNSFAYLDNIRSASGNITPTVTVSKSCAWAMSAVAYYDFVAAVLPRATLAPIARQGRSSRIVAKVWAPALPGQPVGPPGPPALRPIARQGRSSRIVAKVWAPALPGQPVDSPGPPAVRPIRRLGDDWARRRPGRIWQAVRIRLPFDSGDWYDVYGSPAADQPIAYGGSTLIQTQATSWTTAFLSAPGAWSFGVRAANSYGEEQNLDCAVTIVLDSFGNDITNRPAPPAGLRAFATAAGGIRVEWSYPPTRGAGAPTGFYVYLGTGGAPNYATPVATVAFSAAILNTLVANLSGLADGTTYTIGVRAYNASGEEANKSTVSVTADATGPSAVSALSAVAIV